MIHLIGKSLRMVFFGIIPLLLIGSGANTDSAYTKLENGVYQFKFSGLVNYSCTGMASFQNKVKKDVLGNNIISLELSFKSRCNSDLELIEFIISPKSIGANGISAGIYKIKNLEQLINRFNGIYGFADLRSLNELPFFVKNGSITVNEIKADRVVGSLKIRFENADEESLYIQGSFNAK